MIAAGLVMTVFLIGVPVVGLMVVLVWNRRKGTGLKLADIGTILDQAIWAYRRHFVVILSLSTLCIFLGSMSGYGIMLLGLTTVFTTASRASETTYLYSLLTMLVSMLGMLGMLGIGRTLLAYGVAQAVWMGNTGRVASLGSLFRQQPVGKLLGLLAFMIIPAVMAAFMSILGALPALLWALTPATMAFESVGPYVAFQRSYRLVWKNFVALLITLAPLWLMGLIINASLSVGIALVCKALVLPPDLATGIVFLVILLGSIISAPLSAFGAVSFYQYVHG